MKIEKITNGNILIKNNQDEIIQVIVAKEVFLQIHPRNENGVLISTTPTNQDEQEAIVLYVDKITEIDGNAFSGNRNDLITELSKVFRKGGAVGAGTGKTILEQLAEKATVHVDASAMTLDSDIATAKGVVPSPTNKPNPDRITHLPTITPYTKDATKNMMVFDDARRDGIDFNKIEKAIVVLVFRFAKPEQSTSCWTFTNDKGYPFATDGDKIFSKGYSQLFSPSFFDGKRENLIYKGRDNKWHIMIAEIDSNNPASHSYIQRFGFPDRTGSNGRGYIGDVAEFFVFSSANSDFIDDNKKDIYKALNDKWKVNAVKKHYITFR